NLDISYFKNQTKPRVDLAATLSTTGLAGTPSIASVPAGTQVSLIGGDPTTDASAFLLQQLNATRTAVGLPAVTPPSVTLASQSVTSNLIGGYGQTLQNLFNLKTRNIV